MDELERVSAAWLAEHAVREKAFSLGAFERGYIATQPVAVLKRQGRILAFANVMTTAEEGGGDGRSDALRSGSAATAAWKSCSRACSCISSRRATHGSRLAWRPLPGSPRIRQRRSGTASAEPPTTTAKPSITSEGCAPSRTNSIRSGRARYMAVAGGLNPLLAIADVTVLIGGGIRGAISK